MQTLTPNSGGGTDHAWGYVLYLCCIFFFNQLSHNTFLVTLEVTISLSAVKWLVARFWESFLHRLKTRIQHSMGVEG